MADTTKWTFRYDNHGNGGFSEWYDLLEDDERVGRVDDKDDAEYITAALNERDALLKCAEALEELLKAEEFSPGLQPIRAIKHARAALAELERVRQG